VVRGRAQGPLWAHAPHPLLHDPRGECLTLIRRADGAEFTLSSYSRKHRVPHDLAHAVTERELGMPDSIFGCIAAPNTIGVSESLTGVIHAAVEKDRQSLAKSSVR
jgi:hypothetical protein